MSNLSMFISNLDVKTLVLVLVSVSVLVSGLITFILYAVDKSRAKRNKWRIKEKTLILWCFFGGSIGGMLGMYLLRHKTLHIKFKILVPLAFILWVVLYVLYIVFVLL